MRKPSGAQRGWRGGAAAVTRQRTVPAGVTASSRRPGRDGGEAPARRPRRLAVRADEGRRAGADQRDPVRAVGEQPPAPRGARRRGAEPARRALDDRVAQPVPDRLAGGGERADGRDRREQQRGDRRPRPRARAAAAAGRRRDVRVGVRGQRGGPGARERVLLAGHADAAQLLPEAALVHRRSPSSRSSASSPRRRREFTVPRGSSSIAAISPGVYSSR